MKIEGFDVPNEVENDLNTVEGSNVQEEARRLDAMSEEEVKREILKDYYHPEIKEEDPNKQWQELQDTWKAEEVRTVWREIRPPEDGSLLPIETYQRIIDRVHELDGMSEKEIFDGMKNEWKKRKLRVLEMIGGTGNEVDNPEYNTSPVNVSKKKFIEIGEKELKELIHSLPVGEVTEEDPEYKERLKAAADAVEKSQKEIDELIERRKQGIDSLPVGGTSRESDFYNVEMKGHVSSPLVEKQKVVFISDAEKERQRISRMTREQIKQEMGNDFKKEFLEKFGSTHPEYLKLLPMQGEELWNEMLVYWKKKQIFDRMESSSHISEYRDLEAYMKELENISEGTIYSSMKRVWQENKEREAEEQYRNRKRDENPPVVSFKYPDPSFLGIPDKPIRLINEVLGTKNLQEDGAVDETGSRNTQEKKADELSGWANRRTSEILDKLVERIKDGNEILGGNVLDDIEKMWKGKDSSTSEERNLTDTTSLLRGVEVFQLASEGISQER